MTAGAGSGLGMLAIDSGQTGSRLRHVDRGSVREWNAPGVRTDLPLLPQLAELLAQAGRAGCRADVVGIGVSGLTSAEADPHSLLDAASTLGASRVVLAHDSITAYLGALGSQRGVVVAAGTGVVTFAVGTSDVARVDGWGNLIGDAGSGYWLGRAGYEAVMRHYDGRGPATALTGIARAQFADLESAYIELQGDADRVRRIAAFARPIMAAAEFDAVAAAIVRDGARELAHSARAALRRVGEADGEPRVHGIGGLFSAGLLADAFRVEVQKILPDAHVSVGRARPLDGAAALADVGTWSALAPSILIADASTVGVVATQA